jgi:Restriction endonuclease
MEQPKWDEYLLPELKYLSDGKVHKRHEIIDHVVDVMKLTDELKNRPFQLARLYMTIEVAGDLPTLNNLALLSLQNGPLL